MGTEGEIEVSSVISQSKNEKVTYHSTIIMVCTNNPTFKVSFYFTFQSIFSLYPYLSTGLKLLR